MHWNPKSPLKKILKNYNLTSAGIWVAFLFRCPPATELLVVQKPHLDEVVEGPRGAPRFLPLLGRHLDPFLRITLRHFFCTKGFELDLGGLVMQRKMKEGGSKGCWFATAG